MRRSTAFREQQARDSCCLQGGHVPLLFRQTRRMLSSEAQLAQRRAPSSDEAVAPSTGQWARHIPRCCGLSLRASLPVSSQPNDQGCLSLKTQGRISLASGISSGILGGRGKMQRAAHRRLGAHQVLCELGSREMKERQARTCPFPDAPQHLVHGEALHRLHLEAF